MNANEGTVSKRRLAGAYVSSILSISLVLLLIGVSSLLLLNARNVADYFKESVQISMLFKQEVSEKKALDHKEGIDALPYVKSSKYISREEGTEELKELLGEDFLKVFETSPVPLSLEISLKAEYMSPDSLAKVLPQLEDSPLVDEVDCRQSLVEALNANIAKITLVLSFFIALLLFISFVLINNTVRLNIFDRRFSIHTMKMVGATLPFIRKPFLRKSVYLGLVSSAIALLALGILLILLKSSFAELYDTLTPSVIILSGITVIVCGAAICFVSTWFTVGKLVRLGKNELYY